MGLTFLGFGQNFELNRDLGEDQISYQGIYEVDSLKNEELFLLAEEWQDKAKFKQKLKFEDPEKGEKVYEII